MIFETLTLPHGHQFDLRIKCLLELCSAHSSPSIWYATCPCLKNDPMGTPSDRKFYPGAWHRWQNENLIWYVLYLSFVRTHKIFKIGFVIEIKIFWPLPRAPGGGAKTIAVASSIYVSTSHTNFGWISSNSLGGDSITDRHTPTDGCDYNIPLDN